MLEIQHLISKSVLKKSCDTKDTNQCKSAKIIAQMIYYQIIFDNVLQQQLQSLYVEHWKAHQEKTILMYLIFFIQNKRCDIMLKKITFCTTSTFNSCFRKAISSAAMPHTTNTFTFCMTTMRQTHKLALVIDCY